MVIYGNKNRLIFVDFFKENMYNNEAYVYGLKFRSYKMIVNAEIKLNNNHIKYCLLEGD